MQYTSNYNLITVEGTDVVNPLVQMNPNFTDIDAAMFANKQAVIGTATEIVSGTVHAITRLNTDSDYFRFTATGNWNTGDSMSVDGVNVSVYLSDGTTPATGAYIINTEVLALLSGSRVTLIISTSNANLINDKADKTDLTSIIETGVSASQTITADTYFYLNGDLAISLTDITTGATFVLNTNYKPITGGSINELAKHTFGTASDITSYDVDNKFICPYDGYVRCRVEPNGSSYSYITLCAGNGTNLLFQYTPYFANAYHDVMMAVYVKKGSTIYRGSSLGVYSMTFIPLT